jgi:hypothetical protein
VGLVALVAARVPPLNRRRRAAACRRPTADTADPPIKTNNSQAKKSQLPVGPVALGFFLFVVVGSGE